MTVKDWDMSFLKEWSVSFNIPAEKLKQELEAAYETMKQLFPGQAEEILRNKAMNRLKGDNRRQFLSAEVGWIGILIGFEKPRDLWARIRDRQLKNWDDAVKEGKQDEAIARKVAKIEVDSGTGEETVIALCPRYKSNGGESKMFGKPIPSPAQASLQVAFGIAKRPGTPNKPMPFVLELKEEAVTNSIPLYAPVSFRANNRTTDKAEFLSLDSRTTKFIPSDDEELNNAAKNIGILKIIEKFFANWVVEHKTLVEWQKTADADKDFKIPDKYSQLTILKDVYCTYQNLVPKDNDKFVINVDSMEDMSAKNTSIFCSGYKGLISSVDFAEDSKVYVIGRAWMAKPREGQDDGNRVMLEMSGIYADPEYKMPRIDAKKLSAKELFSATSKADKPEEKPKEQVEKIMPAPVKPDESVSTESAIVKPEPAKPVDDPW